MIERLRYLKRMFHSHSFFGWKGYFHLVDLQCKIQNATGTELWNLYEEQHKIMYDYIDRNLKQHRMMDYTGCRAVKNDIDDQNIWVCWLQGESAMPKVVRICYNNLKKNANGHKVILITWNNLNDYLSVSPTIMNKVGKGLSLIAYSDFIRLNLLSIYGGLWVDATFLITAPLDESIFESRFFSIKNNVHSNALVCKYRWAVNFVYASKNSDIMKHIRNLFCAFWEQNKRSINYLLIDYCFEYEAINNRIFTQLLEDMPFTNEHSHETYVFILMMLSTPKNGLNGLAILTCLN